MMKWIKNGECYELHTTSFNKTLLCEDEILLIFAQDKKDKTRWHYISDAMQVEDDDVFADNIEEAKEELEYQIIGYFQDLTDYYENIIEELQNHGAEQND